MNTPKTGILLINTGSPDSPEVPDVKRYLAQFLWDHRVLDMSPFARWLLLNFIILPRRPKESAHAYKQIWTDRGSPLIFHSEDFRDGLRNRLPDYAIEIGMAYGNPSIPSSIDHLIEQGVSRIVLAPMFPQYASATFGAVLEVAHKEVSSKLNVPATTTISPYYNHPRYLDAWVQNTQDRLTEFKPDHILLSFHGLPERHIKNCDPSENSCLQKENCCENYLDHNPSCYKAHCLVTAKGIVERLGLQKEDYTISFQSRLGKDPWIAPATDETVDSLAKAGVKRLAILSPAFVADCIETIEELGIQARESFEENGGEVLELLPSLNSEDIWIDAFAEILQEYL
jgi:protoporphyrin/coproporphyrin ferrochelatase